MSALEAAVLDGPAGHEQEGKPIDSFIQAVTILNRGARTGAHSGEKG